MRYVKLTQGQRAKVDDDLYEWLNQWKWCAKFYPKYGTYYAVRTSSSAGRNKRFLIPMQRQVLGLDAREYLHADHRDRDTLNNQRHNLRPVTISQNQMNRVVAKTNKTGFKGVRASKTPGKFISAICIGNGYKHLGTFGSAEEAHRAYVDAAKAHYGEYARA